MKKQPITVKLQDPIEFGSETISELILQVPKAKHIKTINVQNPSIADILKIASKLSLVSEAALDELTIDDMVAVSDAVGNLLGSGLEIGEK